MDLVSLDNPPFRKTATYPAYSIFSSVILVHHQVVARQHNDVIIYVV